MLNPNHRPAFLFASRNTEDHHVFKTVVAELGAVSLDNVKGALGMMCDGAVDALIVSDDIDDMSAARLIRLARRVDPTLVVIYVCESRRSEQAMAVGTNANVIVERPLSERTLRQLLANVIAHKDEAAPIALSTQQVRQPEPMPLAIARPIHAADLLIVDDDAQLLRMMDRTLRTAGYTTFSAPSPAYAIELLRTTRFQMLVLDVSMPMQTGIELAQQIRNGRYGSGNRDVPIMFVTADNRATTYEETFDVSALRCLIKPFDGEHFCRIVDSLVSHAA